MERSISKRSITNEIQRLQELLSPELQSRVTVVPFEHQNCLISTKRLVQEQFKVQIDFQQWYCFTLEQRDLLFWHEVARIQNRAIARSSWEFIVISIGFSAALMELPSHSLLSFSVALTVAGLAAYRLYQRKLGEQSLREITTADQTAIEFAMQSGYSFQKAYNSLYEALRLLTKQPTQKLLQSKYQVRLQVLEILAARRAEFSQPLALDLNGNKYHRTFTQQVQDSAL